MTSAFPVFPIHLAVLAERPAWSDLLIFQLNGLVVVFVALGSIWLSVTVAGWFFRRAEAAKRAATPAGRAAETPAPAAAPAAMPVPEGGIDAETLAAIAAAVHATLGARYRVRAVATGDMHIEWAQEGRRQIFASHKVR